MGELESAVSKIFEGKHVKINVMRNGEFVEVIGKALSTYPRHLEGMKDLGYELFAFFEIINGTYAAVFVRKEKEAAQQ